MLQGIGPLLGVVLLALGAASGLVLGVRSPTPVALANFDHVAHIERGLDCVDCHDGVQTRADAGVPSIQLCLEACHAEDVAEADMQKTANGRLVLDHFQRGEEPWWPKLYSLPEHVSFSHRRHVIAGVLACARCHGEIAATQRLPTEAVDGVLTMDGCMACHDQHGASNDCFGCHR